MAGESLSASVGGGAGGAAGWSARSFMAASPGKLWEAGVLFKRRANFGKEFAGRHDPYSFTPAGRLIIPLRHLTDSAHWKFFQSNDRSIAIFRLLTVGCEIAPAPRGAPGHRAGFDGDRGAELPILGRLDRHGPRR